MDKSWIAIACAILLLAGCASVKQAHSDLKTGYTSPLEAGEQSPLEQAQPIAATITAVAPFLTPFNGLIATGLSGIFAWKRGNRIRAGKPVSTNPITGYFGNKIGAESLVQNMSNIVTGVFELGANGSPLKRAWKSGLTALLALAGVSMAFPQAQAFLMGNPAIIAAIGGLSALFGGLEKTISGVLPVKPNSEQPAPFGGANPV